MRSVGSQHAEACESPSHLGQLVWMFRPLVDPQPTCSAEVPTRSPESQALAAALKRRGFRFVGPTTMFALMSAIGIVNADIVGTYRRPSARPGAAPAGPSRRVTATTSLA